MSGFQCYLRASMVDGTGGHLGLHLGFNWLAESASARTT